MSQAGGNLDWVKDMKKEFERAVIADPVDAQIEQAIEFARVDREKYVGEVGKRDGVYVYHFYPRTVDVLATFGDKMGDAFLKVFKFADRLSSKHDEIVRCNEGEKEVEEARKAGNPLPAICGFWGQRGDFDKGCCPECGSKNFGISMSSWAVRVTGYADNPLADHLAAKVFDELDTLLKE